MTRAADTYGTQERVPLLTETITVTCRANRGNDGAWDEAVRLLREVYDAQIERFGPTVALHVTISRSRAPGVNDAVWEAVNGGR